MGNSKSMVRNVVKRLIPSYFKDKIRKNIYINPNTANADLRKKYLIKREQREWILFRFSFCLLIEKTA